MTDGIQEISLAMSLEPTGAGHLALLVPHCIGLVYVKQREGEGESTDRCFGT
jgi:hypothetical protein